MNRFHRYVSYVIGTFLVFPLRVIHILPEEEDETKKRSAKQQPSGLKMSTGYGLTRTQQGVKRNRGKAQKDVRVKHQMLAKLKRNK